MSCKGAKIGDVIIGNSLANNCYRYTKEGWIGIITNIDNYGFSAKHIKDGYHTGGLNYECFDFYYAGTAQDLAEKLGFI